MKFHTLAEWLAWQETLHPSEIELGLDRVKSVAKQLLFFNPDTKIKTVIVGGTNGKGSCVAYLEAILIAAGYRVGAYSSPHLLCYNERVRVNGEMVSDQMLCDSFERVDAARFAASQAGTSLTYFEFGTLAALDIFCRAKVDIRILEVGLGGRLDAVNITEPDAVVITNVAMDHEAWLGHTREAIGAEKAGIFRAAIPLVIGEIDPPLSVDQAANGLGNNRLRKAGKDFLLTEHQLTIDFAGLDANGHPFAWYGIPKPLLPLPSAACAIQVVMDLQLANRQAIEAGLQHATLPGRCQTIIYKGCRIILDVAHNPAGAAFLAQWLRKQFVGTDPIFNIVFSALADKDHAGLVAELAPLGQAWYLAPLPVQRAATLRNLQESVSKVRARAQQFDTIGAALERAIDESGSGVPVLVCGSFYTVAEALKYLQQGVRLSGGGK